MKKSKSPRRAPRAISPELDALITAADHEITTHLPVHDKDYLKCSNAIHALAESNTARQSPIPFPSAWLPPLP